MKTRTLKMGLLTTTRLLALSSTSMRLHLNLIIPSSALSLRLHRGSLRIAWRRTEKSRMPERRRGSWPIVPYRRLSRGLHSLSIASWYLRHLFNLRVRELHLSRTPSAKPSGAYPQTLLTHHARLPRRGKKRTITPSASRTSSSPF